MTDENKKYVVITTNIIHKLHPKLVTITVNSVGTSYSTTINLPITQEVYKKMLAGLANVNLHKHLPLTFIINTKGVAFDVMPKYEYDKQKKLG